MPSLNCKGCLPLEPLDYLRALRRRWGVVASSLAVALAVAWFTTQVAPPRPPVREFEATTVLMARERANTRVAAPTGSQNLEAIAALVTVGEVPQRVAKAVSYQGEPLLLARKLKARADTKAQLLQITASSTNPDEAEQLADSFARELLGFLKDRRIETLASQVDFLSKRMDPLRAEIADLDRQIAASLPSDAELLRAARDAKVRRFGLLYESYQQLASDTADTDALEVIQSASAVAVVRGGFQPPNTRKSRLLFAAIVGVAGGLGLALLLERIDTRIRTREAAERHLGLPVVAEIPHVPIWRRQGLFELQRRGGSSPLTEAFALLAASISSPVSRNGSPAKGKDSARDREPPRTILVTSPGPAEGKTTVVANLAATFADLGRTVVVLSCDFRHPRVHELFGVPNEGGLGDALAGTHGAGIGQLASVILPSGAEQRTVAVGAAAARPGAPTPERPDASSPRPILQGRIRETGIRNLRLVPSGSIPHNLGQLLGSEAFQRALTQARAEARVVLIDTAPLLLSSDVTHLLPHVDGVLLVVRAGMTSVEQARRSVEVLTGLAAPTLAAVLNDAREMPVPHGFYRRTLRSRGFPWLLRHRSGT